MDWQQWVENDHAAATATLLPIQSWSVPTDVWVEVNTLPLLIGPGAHALARGDATKPGLVEIVSATIGLKKRSGTGYGPTGPMTLRVQPAHDAKGHVKRLALLRIDNWNCRCSEIALYQINHAVQTALDSKAQTLLAGALALVRALAGPVAGDGSAYLVSHHAQWGQASAPLTVQWFDVKSRGIGRILSASRLQSVLLPSMPDSLCNQLLNAGVFPCDGTSTPLSVLHTIEIPPRALAQSAHHSLKLRQEAQKHFSSAGYQLTQQDVHLIARPVSW